VRVGMTLRDEQFAIVENERGGYFDDVAHGS
jgi:hypothetical protein